MPNPVIVPAQAGRSWSAAEVLAGGDIAQVHLHDRGADGADRVEQGNAGMGIGCRVEDDAVVGESGLLKPVYQCALMVAPESILFLSVETVSGAMQDSLPSSPVHRCWVRAIPRG